MALEIEHLTILPNMVSKAFKVVREKFRDRLPLDFFSTLFLSFLSLEAALQMLEGEVFWVGVCVKNLVGGGCLNRPNGGGRPAWWWGRSAPPGLHSAALSSIRFLLSSSDLTRVRSLSPRTGFQVF
jgi:hypothetical protein